jgi:hypothetical protein
MAEVCVVHLVRAQNGPDPLRRFLASYLAHPAGAEHDLAIVLKGFPGERPTSEILAALEPVPHRRLVVPDGGFDIGSYVAAARALPHRQVCFLNSFSRILADGWLRAMLRVLASPGVGLVGASGTWESPYTNLLRARATAGSSLRALARAVAAQRLRPSFGPFPNPHVRTNAFLIDREAFLRLAPARVRTKMDAYRFESGKQGFTRQVVAAGLRALVAGRDGRGYEPADWPRSATFRAGDQENLLVADNQTEAYLGASSSERAVMSELAWGSPAGMDDAP